MDSYSSLIEQRLNFAVVEDIFAGFYIVDFVLSRCLVLN